MKVWFQRSAAPVGMLVALALLVCLPSGAVAGTILQSAQSFAVLAGSTVTNTAATTITGDVGLYPGTSSTGFGTVTFTSGFLHPTPDAVVGVAQQDNTNAYITLASLLSTVNQGPDLTGLTLTPGVYKFSSNAILNGTLNLNFQGNSNALFVFQIPTTLITGSGAVVTVSNGTATDGIFWQVGTSATLGSSTTFEGNILALTSITLNSSAKILCGRALAQTGAVTMSNNTIADTCTADFGSGGFSPTSSLQITTPEPGTFLLLGMSLVGFAVKFSAGRK